MHLIFKFCFVLCWCYAAMTVMSSSSCNFWAASMIVCTCTSWMIRNRRWCFVAHKLTDVVFSFVSMFEGSFWRFGKRRLMFSHSVVNVRGSIRLLHQKTFIAKILSREEKTFDNFCLTNWCWALMLMLGFYPFFL